MKIRLNLCCFCINVRTGAGIIGSLQMLGSGRCLMDALSGNTLIEAIKSTNDPDARQALFQALRVEYTGFKSLDEIVFFLQIIHIYVFISGLVGLLTALLLCNGLLTEKPKLIFFYLVVNLICYFIAIFCSVFIFVYSGAIVPDFLVIVLVISYLLALYFLLVVYSAYLDVQKAVLENQNPVVVAYSTA